MRVGSVTVNEGGHPFTPDDGSFLRAMPDAFAFTILRAWLQSNTGRIFALFNGK